MALPVITLPTGTVEFDGQSFSVRGISYDESVKIAALRASMVNGNDDVKIEDAAELGVQYLAMGLDASAEEVRAWCNTAPNKLVQQLIAKVMELSGMDGLGEGSSGA